MTPLADLVRRMMEAGCSPDLIADAIEAAEMHAAGKSRLAATASETDEAAERRRERDRERKRAKRHGVSTGHSADNSADIPRTQKKGPPDPPKENQDTPLTPPKGGFPPTAKAELQTVLDAEHAEAVIDHRKRKRAPLTARAAKLLAGKFGQCDDPNAAADAMIVAGWQGFEPQWLERRTVPHGPGPPGSTNGQATSWQRQKQAIDEEFDERARHQRTAAEIDYVDVRRLPEPGTNGR